MSDNRTAYVLRKWPNYDYFARCAEVEIPLSATREAIAAVIADASPPLQNGEIVLLQWQTGSILPFRARVGVEPHKL